MPRAWLREVFSSGVAVSLPGATTQGEYYDESDEQDQGYRQGGPPQLGDYR
jgi:hypothetical protein